MLRKVAVLFVLLFPILSTTAFASPLAQVEKEGNPWWLWLLVLAVLSLFVGFMIWWWLRQPEDYEETMPTSHHAQPVVLQEPGSAEAAVVDLWGGAGDEPFLDTQKILVADTAPVEAETVDLEAVMPDLAEPAPLAAETVDLAMPKMAEIEAVELSEVEPVPAAPDDLTFVEGIGPAIQKVLYAVGINTYRDLAATEPERLRAILREADPHLARMFDPSTWPEQARLAAEGDWAALDTLKGQLKHGRRACARRANRR